MSQHVTRVHRFSGAAALLLLFAPSLSLAVKPARDPGSDPTPRIQAVVRQRTAYTTLAVAPLQDAPATPGSGTWATEILCEVLEARGIQVLRVAPAGGSGETPTHFQGDRASDLAALAKDAGAPAAFAGRISQLTYEERELPGTVVERRRLEVFVPPAITSKTTTGVSLQLVQATGARLACSANGTLGPIRDFSPEAALEILFRGILERCLGPGP